MRYRVRLNNGEVFEGKRPWYYWWTEPSIVTPMFKVTKVEVPSTIQVGDEVCVPRTSIVYMTKVKKQAGE